MRLAAAMMTLCAWAGVAQAFSVTPLDAHDRFRLAGEGRMLELQVLESRQRAFIYQERQRLHREQEREAMRYRPPQLEIPRMQRNCQMQPNGAHFLPNCR